MGNFPDEFLLTLNSATKIDDKYFLLRNEQGHFCFGCKDDDSGKTQEKAVVYKSIEYIPGLNLFVGSDCNTDSCGIIDMHGEELVPCVFQTVVTTNNKIILVDYNNKPYYIHIEEGKSVKDALVRFTKRLKLKLKDAFIQGRISAQPYYRRDMREAIISEEKRWGFEERDVD